MRSHHVYAGKPPGSGVSDYVFTPLAPPAEMEAATLEIAAALDVDPASHYLMARMAAVCLNKHDPAGALEWSAKSLSAVPSCPLALWAATLALSMMGRHGETDDFHRLLSDSIAHNECGEGEDDLRRLAFDLGCRVRGRISSVPPPSPIKTYQPGTKGDEVARRFALEHWPSPLSVTKFERLPDGRCRFQLSYQMPGPPPWYYVALVPRQTFMVRERKSSTLGVVRLREEVTVHDVGVYLSDERD
jgi:hypothetical protein